MGTLDQLMGGRFQSADTVGMCYITLRGKRVWR